MTLGRAGATRTLAALGASLFVAGCGGGKPASAPGGSSATAGTKAECPLVMDPVARFEERLPLAVQDEKDRGSVAAALRMMRGFERETAGLDAALGGMTLRDAELRGKVDAYRTALRKLARVSTDSAGVMVAAAQSMAPPLAPATSAAADLDKACAKPDAPCKAVLGVLKGSGAGASLLDDAPDLLTKGAARLREVRAKRAKAAAATARLADALDGLARSLGETMRASTQQGKALEAAGGTIASPRKALHDYCDASAASPVGEWVTGGGQDVRALTVVVSFKPPGNLTGDFERAAQGASREDEGFYRAAASGGFGSGFVVVRRGESGNRGFVVTNRHVVELSDHVEIVRSDGTQSRARIVYADPHYDLAVVALEGAGATFERGFDLDTAGVKDQEAVVAVGYPGLANHPSYQVTKGYVSNERFELDSGDMKLPYFQHTAAIDRGSSGGPLLSDAGRVLGVNTLKAFGREGVAFAVPSSAVASAVRYAAGLDAAMESASFRRQTLRDDCLDLVAELIQAHPRVERIEKLVSTRMVAEEGASAYDAEAQGDESDELQKRFADDPVDAYRVAVALKLIDDVKAAGGVAATETCAAPNAGDVANIMTVDRVRVPVRVGNGEAEVVMRWEQGRWKVVRVGMGR